jgi:hypothetical protein
MVAVLTAPDIDVFAAERRSAGYLQAGWSLWLGVAGLALWGLALVQADYARMGPYGLVTTLGWPYFVGLALLVVGLAIELLRDVLRPSRLLFLVVALVLVLFGTASAVEPTARLTDSWLHAGFVQYISQHGHVLENFDARFSWPGSLSLGSVLVAFTGQADAVGFLRWAPVAFELLYLPPLLVIARCSGVSARAGWLGVVLFYAANWIDQDYFSPQAVNYLFYLVVVAAVLACWKPVRSIAARRSTDARARLTAAMRALSRRRLAGHDARSDWPRGLVLAVLGVLTLVVCASAMSHQLTPYALVLALVACLLGRRLGRPELIVVTALVTVGWLSLGASNYWIGHLSQIFGSVGHAGSTFGANVSNRLTGSQSHLMVVRLRILSMAALFVLALVGALRRSPDSRALELLAAAPFLLLAFQSYGGEVLLRVVLFGLPFTALLAAAAMLPDRMGPIRPLVRVASSRPPGRVVLRILIATVVLGFALLTTVVRGGNDVYESFSTGELAAVNYAYDQAHGGQTIGAVAPYLPIGQRAKGEVAFYDAADQVKNTTVRSLTEDLLRAHPDVVILSRAQEAWGENVAGFAPGWEQTVSHKLQRSGYRVAARWPTATVLRPFRAGTP